MSSLGSTAGFLDTFSGSLGGRIQNTETFEILSVKPAITGDQPITKYLGVSPNEKITDDMAPQGYAMPTLGADN